LSVIGRKIDCQTQIDLAATIDVVEESCTLRDLQIKEFQGHFFRWFSLVWAGHG